jgi:aspartyl-tRNA(Asn)/glutamyl-tRNA(Gln) amidotransferase subunit B
MSNFIATIGLEIHIQLNTKTKMFSTTANNFQSNVNTNVNEYDLGQPGAMPRVNIEAIRKATIFAKALNMQIDTNMRFDRKNYLYHDLPKGYQITQQFYPFAKNGIVNLPNGSIIHIERFHLEEDSAKQIKQNDGSILIDYNRSGTPLIEIVTHPDFHDGQSTSEYLIFIKRILTFLNISDAKMEEGSMRVDVNVSVSNTNQLGVKNEIKNINSIKNVALAIDYEIARQTKLLQDNQTVIQETRR